MPVYSRTELGLAASSYGFQRDVFEKVLRLRKLLVDFKNETLLADHLVLKGGTAINLTILSLPRLSVDIDMDYVPNDSREEMLSTRKRISDMIRRYMASEGYHLSDNSRSSHSLDSFHFQYQNSAGNNDVLNKISRRRNLHSTSGLGGSSRLSFLPGIVFFCSLFLDVLSYYFDGCSSGTQDHIASAPE